MGQQAPCAHQPATTSLQRHTITHTPRVAPGTEGLAWDATPPGHRLRNPGVSARGAACVQALPHHPSAVMTGPLGCARCKHCRTPQRQHTHNKPLAATAALTPPGSRRQTQPTRQQQHTQSCNHCRREQACTILSRATQWRRRCCRSGRAPLGPTPSGGRRRWCSA
jgi:hypothetical protein